MVEEDLNDNLISASGMAIAAATSGASSLSNFPLYVQSASNSDRNNSTPQSHDLSFLTELDSFSEQLGGAVGR